MNDDVREVLELFNPLYPSPEEELGNLKNAPFLAHYTFISALESILKTDEIWFSNPLFMNDLEEVRFGVVQGAPLLRSSVPLLKSLDSDERRRRFTSSFDHYFAQYDSDHAFDTYVFCLSRHDPQNSDGRLSMWRGYGSDGNGAAIIFDTSKITLRAESPLILSKVHYGSAPDRLKWIESLGERIAKIVCTNEIQDDKVDLIAFAAFERLKQFALFTKHVGFSEEEEWRVVYMPDRDSGSALKAMLGYVNGPRGVQPKLKLKIAPLPGAIPDGVTLNNLIAQILLGPTTSSSLAQRSVRRMLDLIERSELKDRLGASTIPLREPTSH